MSEKPEQLEPFSRDKYWQEVVSFRFRWYYIVSPDERWMVAGTDDAGRPYMVIHDVQHIIPHTFQSAQAAHAFARTYDLPHKVKSCSYTRINGNTVVIGKND